MDVDIHDGYVGHKVTALVIVALPMLADLDILNDPWQRFIFAACGGLGAILAMIGDKPKSINDAIVRFGGGIFSCLLFGPWIAMKVGQTDTNGMLLTFGVIGAISFYAIGSASRLFTTARDKNWLGEYVKWRLGVKEPPALPGQTTTLTIQQKVVTPPVTPPAETPPKVEAPTEPTGQPK